MLGLPSDRPLLRIARAVPIEGVSSRKAGCGPPVWVFGQISDEASCLEGGDACCTAPHLAPTSPCRAGPGTTLPAPSTGRLADVHVGIAPSRVRGGTQHVVQGSYLYYHYMQVTTGIGHHLRGGWGENACHGPGARQPPCRQVVVRVARHLSRWTWDQPPFPSLLDRPY